MKDLFKRAYEKYPEAPGGFFAGEMVDSNSDMRLAFISGYNEAEKDFELGWRDIDTILTIYDEVKGEFCDNPKAFLEKMNGLEVTPENFKKTMYTDILKRYREKKEQ